MGFTRYYTIHKRLNGEDFSKFSKDTESICKWINKVYGHKIAGWNGQGDPEFTDELVSFNGCQFLDKDVDESHETFEISLESKGFNFTKTQLKPYDKHVFATLLLAEFYFGDSIEISGDGEDDDYPEITKVVKSFLRDRKINEIIS